MYNYSNDQNVLKLNGYCYDFVPISVRSHDCLDDCLLCDIPAAYCHVGKCCGTERKDGQSGYFKLRKEVSANDE